MAKKKQSILKNLRKPVSPVTSTYIITFAVVLFLLVFAIYKPSRQTSLSYQRPYPYPVSHPSNQSITPTAMPTPTITLLSPTLVDTTSWKFFSSKRYGFALRYPPDWQVIDASGPEGSGAIFFDSKDFELGTSFSEGGGDPTTGKGIEIVVDATIDVDKYTPHSTIYDWTAFMANNGDLYSATSQNGYQIIIYKNSGRTGHMTEMAVPYKENNLFQLEVAVADMKRVSEAEAIGFTMINTLQFN